MGIRYETPGIGNHAYGEITRCNTKQHQQGRNDHAHACAVPPRAAQRKGSAHPRATRGRIDLPGNVAGLR